MTLSLRITADGGGNVHHRRHGDTEKTRASAILELTEAAEATEGLRFSGLSLPGALFRENRRDAVADRASVQPLVMTCFIGACRGARTWVAVSSTVSGILSRAHPRRASHWKLD